MNSKVGELTEKKRLKILVVAGGIVLGGVSRVVSLLTQEWQKEHDVSISLFKGDLNLAYPVGGTIVQKNIPLKGCQISRVYWLYRLLKKNKFDKIISFSEDANYPLVIAARLANVNHKVTLSIHNSVDTFSIKSMKRMTRFYPWANTIFAVSNAVRKGLIQSGLPSDKVKTVLNPLDIKMIDQLALAPSSSTIHLKDGVIHLVSLGRLHPYKGFDLLIEAFYQLFKQYKHIHLSIIGEGEQRDSLLKKINQFGLGAHITLLGQLKNPFPILVQADIFILPSIQEGWGLALTEAMYLGLPAVAFDCKNNGPQEIIQNNQNGLLAKSFEVADLVEKIERLIVSEVLREQLGKAGKKTVTGFNVQEVAKSWLIS
ncbi:MAG: glycosyltransferase [Thiomicrorhabdus sp.]|nr:glycosyltransferase [Thiomicrorhabdus sp.]MCF6344954.1 glycosyltransferase [Thiomicrorhabdus sp.]